MQRSPTFTLPPPAARSCRAFNNSGREKMGVLSRYEVTLERSLYKALHELRRLQAARDGQAVPLPEAVDVDISISTRDEGHQLARRQPWRA